MGVIIKPMCQCNQEFKELFVGVGMMETEKFKVPSSCGICGTIFLKNLFEENPRCTNSKCRRRVEFIGDFIPYDSNSEGVIEWDFDLETRYVLSEKKYKCPKCKEEELEFKMWGLWD